jgi:Ubiquitin-2 like Rad60 SUMO-like
LGGYFSNDRAHKTDMPDCDDGENLRLICMGKGYLSPDSRTLDDCHIPVFKTHPTPVNVSVKPSTKTISNNSTSDNNKKKHHNNSSNNANASNNHTANNTSSGNANTTASGRPSSNSSNPNHAIETGQGCCIIS